LRLGDVTQIANLNRARKAKARAEARVQAAHNRAAFGRMKAQKTADHTAKAKSDAALDGHKREP
jgi:hypothetical protein